jgi:hypothetical protein
MIDLSNPLEWNLVIREAVSSVNNLPIPPLPFIVNSYEIVVGVKVADEPTWKWGGYLNQRVIALPSSTAQLFSNLVQTNAWRLTCQNYQAIALDRDKPLPYSLQITFPPYFRAAQVEVFARNDIDPDVDPIIVP